MVSGINPPPLKKEAVQQKGLAARQSCTLTHGKQCTVLALLRAIVARAGRIDPVIVARAGRIDPSQSSATTTYSSPAH